MVRSVCNGEGVCVMVRVCNGGCVCNGEERVMLRVV